MLAVPCVGILPPANQGCALPLSSPLECTQTVPGKLKTLGGHIKKRRIELHLLQSQLAKLLGVGRISVQNWERGIYEPSNRVIEKVIEFLGYDPRNQSKQVIPR
jgi:DNA-binding XRE family transcriptional regulator